MKQTNANKLRTAYHNTHPDSIVSPTSSMQPPRQQTQAQSPPIIHYTAYGGTLPAPSASTTQERLPHPRHSLTASASQPRPEMFTSSATNTAPASPLPMPGPRINRRPVPSVSPPSRTRAPRTAPSMPSPLRRVTTASENIANEYQTDILEQPHALQQQPPAPHQVPDSATFSGYTAFRTLQDIAAAAIHARANDQVRPGSHTTPSPTESLIGRPSRPLVGKAQTGFQAVCRLGADFAGQMFHWPGQRSQSQQARQRTGNGSASAAVSGPSVVIHPAGHPSMLPPQAQRELSPSSPPRPPKKLHKIPALWHDKNQQRRYDEWMAGSEERAAQLRKARANRKVRDEQARAMYEATERDALPHRLDSSDAQRAEGSDQIGSPSTARQQSQHLHLVSPADRPERHQQGTATRSLHRSTLRASRRPHASSSDQATRVARSELPDSLRVARNDRPVPSSSFASPNDAIPSPPTYGATRPSIRRSHALHSSVATGPVSPVSSYSPITSTSPVSPLSPSSSPTRSPRIRRSPPSPPPRISSLHFSRTSTSSAFSVQETRLEIPRVASTPPRLSLGPVNDDDDGADFAHWATSLDARILEETGDRARARRSPPRFRSGEIDGFVRTRDVVAETARAVSVQIAQPRLVDVGVASSDARETDTADVYDVAIQSSSDDAAPAPITFDDLLADVRLRGWRTFQSSRPARPHGSRDEDDPYHREELFFASRIGFQRASNGQIGRKSTI